MAKQLYSLLQEEPLICSVCSRGMFPNIYDTRHVFNGAYKRKSEEDGMVLFIHRECHRSIHDNADVQRAVKKEAERVWLSIYGSREEFIERYGKDYLWDEEKS